MGDIIEIPNILNVHTYDFSPQANLARTILNQVPDRIKMQKFTRDGVNLLISEIDISTRGSEPLNNKIDMLNVFQSLTTTTNWNVVDYNVKYPSLNKAKWGAIGAWVLFFVLLLADLLCGFLLQGVIALALSMLYLSIGALFSLIYTLLQ